jgi:hypothetical protein
MKTPEITSLRLHNKRLSTTTFKTADEVVDWLGAVQAQDYAGAKWALAQRAAGMTDADVDQAFADGSILRTHLLRPTWHFVTPKDIRWLLMLTAPRVHAANAYYYRKTGLDTAAVKRCNSVIARTLQGGKHLTRMEIASALEKAGISTDGELRATYIMMRAELDGVICSGPRRGKQFTYALLEERVPQVKEMSREDALAELVRRYFVTRGPATLQDFVWWSGLTMADAKNGIDMIKSQFASESINGQQYWFGNSRQPAKPKSPIAYLLPNYDEYFIGLKDRSAIGEVAKQAGIKGDDPALIAHIIILDGQVVGGWRRTLKKDAILVEASLITKLSSAEKQAVIQAAERYGKFLGLPLSIACKERINKAGKTQSIQG